MNRGTAPCHPLLADVVASITCFLFFYLSVTIQVRSGLDDLLLIRRRGEKVQEKAKGRREGVGNRNWGFKVF